MKLLYAVVVIFLSLFAQPVFAQTCPNESRYSFESGHCEKITLPEFASFNKEKNDWVCQIGFKKIASLNKCQKVEIPEHGKLNYSGDDFICERGFKKINSSCQEIKLPENGTLDSSGNDWSCIATYKRESDICIKVVLPENAKFFSRGFDFFCSNQYEKVGGKCQKFEIPANGHLTYLGNDWQCNKGYLKNQQNQSCDPIFIPQYAQVNSLGTFYCDPGYDKIGGECQKTDSIQNGSFYEQGSQFYCLSGYLKNEELRKCEKITIPENAKLDTSSIDGWSCLGGYIKKDQKCEKFETEHIIWVDNTWTCETGYKKDYGSQNCQKISLPENAHFENNTDGWSCNTGYIKNYRENRCDKST